MNGLWQTTGGKVVKREIPIKATIRKIEEKTGIILKDKDLKYLFNNPEFNCNVYITKVSKDYQKNSYSCNKNDHHAHWYYTKCYQCANSYGIYISLPTEQTICQCNEHEYYEYLNMTANEEKAEYE
ncbi:1031_t:CDS:2 [Funneliformis geosporum]|nr:1031_t:CDS:2 [Funneliformis geosporum]